MKRHYLIYFIIVILVSSSPSQAGVCKFFTKYFSTHKEKQPLEKGSLTQPNANTAAVTFELYSNSHSGKLHDITTFYNNFFPDSQHRESYKQNLYENKSRKPIVLFIITNGNIIGLLESWMGKDDPTKRILVTILIHPNFRGRGYAGELFKRATEYASRLDEENFVWVVHFRDNNKNLLEPMYSSFGFSELRQNGTYSNSEAKWEMIMYKKNT